MPDTAAAAPMPTDPTPVADAAEALRDPATAETERQPEITQALRDIRSSDAVRSVVAWWRLARAGLAEMRSDAGSVRFRLNGVGRAALARAEAR